MLLTLIAVQCCATLASTTQRRHLDNPTIAAAAASFGESTNSSNTKQLLSALTKHEIGSSLADLASLDAAEQAELHASLTKAGVPLGTRSRLRRAAGSAGRLGLAGPKVDDARLHLLLTGKQLPQHAAAMDPPTPRHTRDCPEEAKLDAPPRRLQDGGVSSDSIALMATAALGILSFIVQARVAASEAKDRADLDREHAQRQKEEAKAGKQLERVQLQMAEFLVRQYIVYAARASCDTQRFSCCSRNP